MVIESAVNGAVLSGCHAVLWSGVYGPSRLSVTLRSRLSGLGHTGENGTRGRGCTCTFSGLNGATPPIGLRARELVLPTGHDPACP